MGMGCGVDEEEEGIYEEVDDDGIEEGDDVEEGDEEGGDV